MGVALARSTIDHKLLGHGSLVLVSQNVAVQHNDTGVNVGPVSHVHGTFVGLKHVVPVSDLIVDVLVVVAESVDAGNKLEGVHMLVVGVFFKAFELSLYHGAESYRMYVFGSVKRIAIQAKLLVVVVAFIDVRRTVTSGVSRSRSEVGEVVW